MNYTAYDFLAIKEALIAKLSQEESWKDYNFSGAHINTLLELISYVGDIFGYYTNMIANESFIQTASLYENLNKLSELVGYKPGGYKSSTVDITLTSKSAEYNLTNKDNYKITIPKFSRFLCSEPSADGDVIYFTNPIDAVFVIDTSSLSAPLSGQSIAFDIPLVQGNPTNIGDEVSFVSDGSAFQKFIITDENAIEEYIIVTVNDVVWEQVDNMYKNTDSTSKIYTTRFNKNKKVEIAFGDGIFGAIPPVDNTIKIRYISSLGSLGNINTGLITSLENDIIETDSDVNSIVLELSKFTITQSEQATGGLNPESEDQLRQYAPAFYRTQNRAVTKQDYEDIITSNFNEYIYAVKALNYKDLISSESQLNERLSEEELIELETLLLNAGLTQAEAHTIMYGPEQTKNIIYFNNIYLLMVPRFGDYITNTLRNNIDTFLADYKMVTVNHIYLDPEYILVNIDVKYTKTSTSKTIAEIEMKLKEVITDYFTKENRSIGELLLHSDLVDLLKSIEGVKSINLEMQREDSPSDPTNANIQLIGTEFPKLNDITITLQ